MITGIALYLMVLLILRTPSFLLDRGWREHLRWRLQHSYSEALEGFEQSLTESGYRVIGPHPFSDVLHTRLRRSLILIKWLPLALGFAVFVVLGVSAWIIGVVLSIYVVGMSLATDYFYTSSGARPLEGDRTSKEWRILLPAVALQLALGAAGYAVGFASISAWNTKQGLLAVVMMVGSIVLLAVAHLPVRLALRLGRTMRGPCFSADAPDNSVLYLRPFSDDVARIAWPQGIGFLGSAIHQLVRPRFEELIAVSLLSDGPLLAIGRPGEPLPELGAARTYWADDEWEQAVSTTAHRVARVVLVAGLTGGIRWEVERLQSWSMLRKALIVIPPGSRADSLARVGDVLKVLDIEGPDLTHFMPGGLLAIGFDAQDCPVFFTCTARRWWAYFVMMQMHALLVSGDAELDLLG